MTKTEELRAKEEQLVALKQWRTVLSKIVGELQRMRDLLPRRRDRFQHIEYDRLTSALRYCEIGLEKQNGVAFVPFDLMAPMVGKPGFEETDDRIEALEAECTELRKWVKRWPTPDTTHEYRYTGRPDKTSIDGRYVEPGDIVPLTETRALALADRFEPV